MVASEVRTLAQRSAAAAKEIKGLIGDSVEKVDAGARLVDQAGATLAQVVGVFKLAGPALAAPAAAQPKRAISTRPAPALRVTRPAAPARQAARANADEWETF